MEQKNSPLLFYFDTESAGEKLIELGVVNAIGDEVINTLVVHDKPWSSIYEEGDERTRLWMIAQRTKFKWDDRWEFPPGTKVMTAAQVSKTMKQWGMNRPEARIIEYSSGDLDTTILRHFLEENGGFDSALGNHCGYGLLPIWQQKLPGFWWLSQDNIFALTHPYHELTNVAHNAMIEAKKLRQLFQDAINDSAV